MKFSAPGAQKADIATAGDAVAEDEAAAGVIWPGAHQERTFM